MWSKSRLRVGGQACGRLVPREGTWVVSVDLKAHSLLSMVVLGENLEGSGRRVGFQPFVEGEPAAEHAASYCAFRKLAAYRIGCVWRSSAEGDWSAPGSASPHIHVAGSGQASSGVVLFQLSLTMKAGGVASCSCDAQP